MNYRNRFKTLISELESNERLALEHAEVMNGLDEANITEIEKKAGMKLPDLIRNFYKETNGVNIEWRVDFTKIKQINESFPEDLTGVIKILSLDRMLFGGNEERPWYNNLWFDFMDENQLKQTKNLRPFDFFNNDDKEFVAFDVTDINDSKLYYHHLEEGSFNFKLNLDAYINKTILFKGFLFWQRAYLFKGKAKRELNLYFKQVFPNTEIDLNI